MINRTVSDFDDWTSWLLYKGGVGVKGDNSWESWWEEEQVCNYGLTLFLHSLRVMDLLLHHFFAKLFEHFLILLTFLLQQK